jgi:hypothetical protein
VDIKERFLQLREIAEADRASKPWNADQEGDGIHHTCGAWARPKDWVSCRAVGLSSMRVIKLKEKQLAVLLAELDTIGLDPTYPLSLWPDFFGMWHHFAIVNAEPESGDYNSGNADNFLKLFAHPENVEESLSRLSTDLVDSRLQHLLEERSSEWVLKNRTTDWHGNEINDFNFEDEFQRRLAFEKRMLAAEKLVEAFSAAIHKCTHPPRRRCQVCEGEYLPQASYRLARSMPPVLCPRCTDVLSGDVLWQYAAREFSGNPGIAELVVSGLRLFYETFGVIPSSDYNPKKLLRASYLAGWEAGEFPLELLAVGLLPNRNTAKAVFGDWPSLLDATGLLEGTRSGYGGYRSYATDGHLCLSLSERSICEFFTAQGMDHEKEVFYPRHPELNPNALFRCDYKVDDEWIEFAGRMSDPSYAKRMADKTEILRISGFELTVLTPENLDEFFLIRSNKIFR